MDESKVNSLEEMIAHHERQITELSDVVARQWDEIDALKAQLSRTQTKLKTVEETAQAAGSGDVMSVADFAAQEKPPHY